MAKVTDMWRVPDAHRRTAAAVAGMIDSYGDVLWGLQSLRGLGSAAAEAVQAVLSVPAIKQLRLSWELWAALADGDGVDLELLLLRHVSADDAEVAKAALFGLPSTN